MGLWDNGAINTDQQLAKGDDNVRAFQRWTLGNGKRIERYLGLKISDNKLFEEPMRIIKAFVARAGVDLKVVSKRSGGSRNSNYKNTYGVNLSRQDWLNKYAEKRKIDQKSTGSSKGGSLVQLIASN